MYLEEFHKEFLELNKATVKIDGILHRLEVVTSVIKYPYKARVISVNARPINKDTKYYLDIKEQLGDDWSVDVLNNPELAANVLSQVKGK